MKESLHENSQNQLYTKSIHSENKSKKPNVKRSLSMVLNCLLITSATLGTIVFSGSTASAFGPSIYAQPDHTHTTNDSTNKWIQECEVEDAEKRIFKLNDAREVIETAGEKGELNLSMLNNLSSLLIKTQLGFNNDVNFYKDEPDFVKAIISIDCVISGINFTSDMSDYDALEGQKAQVKRIVTDIEKGLNQTLVKEYQAKFKPLDLSGVKNNFTVLPDRSNIDLNYVWQIPVKQHIDKIVSTEGIYVQDTDGNKIPVTAKIGNDNSSLVVTPSTSYKPDTKYTLYVTGITFNGGTLMKGIKMNFTTVAENSINKGTATLSNKTAISNLNAATEGISNAIADEQWNISILEKFCSSLTVVENNLNLDSSLEKDPALLEAISHADDIINSNSITFSKDANLQNKIDQSRNIVKDIKIKLAQIAIKGSIKDTQTLISDLNSATTALKSTIDSGVYDLQTFNIFAQKLDGIEAKLTLDPNSRTDTSLKSAVSDANNFVATIQLPSTSTVANYDKVLKRPAMFKNIIARINKVMNLPTTPQKSINGILVKYGTHDYNCKTQAEYDALMDEIQNAILLEGNRSQRYSYMERYDNGERYTDKNLPSQVSQGLSGFESYATFLSHTDKQYHVPIVIKSDEILGNLFDISGRIKVTDAYARVSGFEELFKGMTKCDGTAQIYSAVYDSLGFSTQIIGGNDHAECLVRVGDYWWLSGGLTNINPASAEFIVVDPTY